MRKASFFGHDHALTDDAYCVLGTIKKPKSKQPSKPSTCAVRKIEVRNPSCTDQQEDAPAPMFLQTKVDCKSPKLGPEWCYLSDQELLEQALEAAGPTQPATMTLPNLTSADGATFDQEPRLNHNPSRYLPIGQPDEPDYQGSDGQSYMQQRDLPVLFSQPEPTAATIFQEVVPRMNADSTQLSIQSWSESDILPGGRKSNVVTKSLRLLLLQTDKLALIREKADFWRAEEAAYLNAGLPGATVTTTIDLWIQPTVVASSDINKCHAGAIQAMKTFRQLLSKKGAFKSTGKYVLSHIRHCQVFSI